MWTDKALESLIPIAAALIGSDRRVSTYLTQGSRCPDPEQDPQAWRSWTPGLRAYHILFDFVVRRGNLDLLYRLCPREQAERLYREMTAERKARYRELTLEADWNTAVSRMAASHARQTQDGATRPQHRGWTREDVVAEYYDETGEPRLGPPRKKAEPIMPEYDQSPSPVRKVSPEEYLRTKRNPVYGGVKPEFAKESEHFAKELPDSADKIFDGTPLDELIGQTT